MSVRRHPVQFETVFETELQKIRERRESAGFESSDAEPLESVPGGNGSQEPSDDPLQRGDAAKNQYDDVKHRAGLALSGGGIRSASFNLGVLQSFYRLGILRHFDYLSTVSGGGYTGAFVTSLALNDKLPKLKQSPEAQGPAGKEPEPESNGPAWAGKCDKEEFATHATGRQPPLIRRLIQGGMYLRKPAKAFNRYLFGLVLINLVIASATCSVMCGLAWLFRVPDQLWCMNLLAALGFQGDVLRALAPASLFGVLWFLTWIKRISTERGLSVPRQPSWWTTWLRYFNKVCFGAMLASLAFALVSLLVTGDLSLGLLYEHDAPSRDFLQSLTTVFVYILAALVMIASLPALGINRLIQSGAAPKNPAESIVFRIVSTALIVGLPLLVFGFFVREDVSGLVSKRMRLNSEESPFQRPERIASLALDFRDPRLVSPMHIKQWQHFWRGIEQEAQRATSGGAQYAPSLWLWNAAGLEPLSAADGRESGTQVSEVDPRQSSDFKWDVLEDSIENAIDYDDLRKNTWLYQRVLTWKKIPPDAPKFLGLSYAPLCRDFWEMRENANEYKDTVVDRINYHCLGNPTFHRAFAAFHAEMKPENTLPPGAKPRQIIALRDRAEGLEQIYRAFLDENDASEHDASENNGERPQAKRDGLLDEIRTINRGLLQSYLGEKLHDDSTVFAYVVIEADQQTRLHYLAIFGAAFLVFGLISLNHSSSHGFYRDRLADMWLVTPADETRAANKTYLLHEAATTNKGAPYLLINATVYLRPPMLPFGKAQSDVPGESALAAFLFSPEFCGSRRLDFVATDDYAEYELAGVMALSGGVVSPMMDLGLPLRVLLALANIRLGQWVPNPARNTNLGRYGIMRSAIVQFFQSACLHPRDRWSVFVSDGGHYENLGIEALLQRRTRVIVAVDAGHDPAGRYIDLLRMIRRNRTMSGCRIELLYEGGETYAPDMLGRLSGDLTSFHYSVLRVEYPQDDPLRPQGESASAYDVREGYIIYAKPSFTNDEAIELLGYRNENRQFPFDSTIDQFYDQRRFESYRHLGEHIGERLCLDVLGPRLNPNQTNPDPDPKRPWLAEWSGRSAQQRMEILAEQQTMDTLPPHVVRNDNFETAVSWLRHGDSEARKLAAHSIGEAASHLSHENKERAVAALADAAVAETDPFVREAMIWCLGEFGESARGKLDQLEKQEIRNSRLCQFAFQHVRSRLQQSE
jgi:hypothetical protein